MSKKWETVLTPPGRWGRLNFKELWGYRDLIKMFVKRNFTIMYKQTILGPLWLILNPLMTSVIFTVVFGNFAHISTDGIPQMLFYMAGNTIWGLFSSCVTGTANTFTGNAVVFGKIYFPRMTVPISQAITALVNFGIQFAMLMIFFFYFMIMGEISVSWKVLIIPILLLEAMLLGMGVGVIVSSLTTKYRDLAIAVGFGIQLWMYATPIVYPLGETGGLMRMALLANPMTAVVNNFRYALLGSGELLVGSWALSWFTTMSLLVLGLLLFGRIEKTFMDTV